MSPEIFPLAQRQGASALFHSLSNLWRITMTKTEFMTECAKRTIDPQLALENDELCEALKDRDDVEVIRILNEEF
jgi:hypothetical protein